MRQLEQRQRQAEQRQAERQHSVDRCKDLMQRNESALQQLRVASESATARQEQQLDNLQATLHMLESRLTTLTPRFEEIAELRARNEALQRRLAEATAQRSGESLAGATEQALETLRCRVESLERRVMRVTAPAGRARTSPAPVPLAALQQQVAEGSEGSKESKEKVEDDHYMPRLRRAFATPKLPSFMVKAVMSRPREQTELICTLPPYSHM